MNVNSMHIHPYEKRWMVLSVLLLAVFTIAVAVAAFALGIQVPSPEQRVDPRTVASDPNSPWANPGLREIAPGRYEAYILAQTWQFLPREIQVPLGARVTFYVTSKDVQHTFKIQNTNINVQVIPGQVSKLTVTFDEAGVYPFICSEYCGAGHAGMFGQIVVTP